MQFCWSWCSFIANTNVLFRELISSTYITLHIAINYIVDKINIILVPILIQFFIQLTVSSTKTIWNKTQMSLIIEEPLSLLCNPQWLEYVFVCYLDCFQLSWFREVLNICHWYYAIQCLCCSLSLYIRKYFSYLLSMSSSFPVSGHGQKKKRNVLTLNQKIEIVLH